MLGFKSTVFNTVFLSSIIFKVPVDTMLQAENLNFWYLFLTIADV